MKRLFEFLSVLFGAGTMASAQAQVPAAPPGAAASESVAHDEAFEQSVLDARLAFYERTFGPLPDDLMKMLDMSGAWPGGGFYQLPAPKIAPGTWVHVTYGFTNADMPTTVIFMDPQFETDELGRVTNVTGTLKPKERAVVAPGLAGYGYELAILTDGPAEWPQWLLQWIVHAELNKDVGLLARVEKYDGLTVEDVQSGESTSVNLLFAKARAPLPAGTDLPNGRLNLLVATVITEDEMRWSMEHGREALLDRLFAAGVGQVSRPGRASVPLEP